MPNQLTRFFWLFLALVIVVGCSPHPAESAELIFWHEINLEERHKDFQDTMEIEILEIEVETLADEGFRLTFELSLRNLTDTGFYIRRPALSGAGLPNDLMVFIDGLPAEVNYIYVIDHFERRDFVWLDSAQERQFTITTIPTLSDIDLCKEFELGILYSNYAVGIPIFPTEWMTEEELRLSRESFSEDPEYQTEWFTQHRKVIDLYAWVGSEIAVAPVEDGRCQASQSDN